MADPVPTRPAADDQILRAVLDSTADGILVVDDHGRVLMANQRFTELWGIPRELAETRDDRKLLEFVLDQLCDPQAFLAKVEQLYGSSHESLDILQLKMNRVFERYSAPLLRDGAIMGRVWSFRDITVRTRMESALRESEARFRFLYNASPVLMHSVDAAGRVVEVNDHWLAVMGYRREQVLGRRVVEFLSEQSQAYAENVAIPRLMRRGGVKDVRLEFITASGETIDALLTGLAVYDDNGVFERAIAVAVDVSERRRAEAERRRMETQMMHAQKLESLGVLAGGIAHDFNNLLVGILGNADLALAEIAAGAPGRERLSEIVESSERAAELCGQLLAYTGKGQLDVRPIDLSDLVRDTANLLAVSLSSGVALDYQLADDLPAVDVDVTQIRQILMNLVTNASEAVGDSGGHVTVRTDVADCSEAFLQELAPGDGLPAGRYAVVEVTDDGRGMDDDVRSRIFDPFFTSKDTGRGLGLASTTGIIRRHRGAIRVDSELGVGSRFRVFLPTSSAAAEPVHPPPAVDREWHGEGLLLVVDDDRTVRKVASRVLEGAGFEVIAVASGREAIETYRRRGTEISAVLLDMAMPDLDGGATFAELSRIDPDVVVVLSTGYDAKSAVQDDRGCTPAGYLQKPYHAHALIDKFRELLS